MDPSSADGDGKVAQIARSVRLLDARVMMRRASNALNEGDYVAAAESLSMAIGSYRFAKEMEGEAEALSMRAMCRAAMGEMNEAMRDLGESLRLNERMKDEEGAATDHLIIARLRLRLGDTKGAESSARDALALFEKLHLEEEARQARKVISSITAA
jgi:tetratricopeptide (TPR) repeat protein